jgi:hypothetical protein
LYTGIVTVILSLLLGARDDDVYDGINDNDDDIVVVLLNLVVVVVVVVSDDNCLGNGFDNRDFNDKNKLLLLPLLLLPS